MGPVVSIACLDRLIYRVTIMTILQNVLNPTGLAAMASLAGALIWLSFTLSRVFAMLRLCRIDSHE